MELRVQGEQEVTGKFTGQSATGKRVAQNENPRDLWECPYGIWLRTDSTYAWKSHLRPEENILRKDQKRVAHSHTEQVRMPILTNQMNQAEKIYNSCGSGGI